MKDNHESKENEEIMENITPSVICPNCAFLELWQSNAHNTKQWACSKRKLLMPKEIECCEYMLIGEKPIKYICRSCKRLEVWTSNDKTVTAEVCAFCHLLLPMKEKCDAYLPVGEK